MIVSNEGLKESVKMLDKKHIFVVILALKQLCVHPWILLKKSFEAVHNPIFGGGGGTGQKNLLDSSDEELEISKEDAEIDLLNNDEKLI